MTRSRTISSTTNFDRTLTAALSTSKSPGHNSLSVMRCSAARAADALASVSAVDFFGGVSVPRFQPDCTTEDKLWDAKLTERIACLFFSSKDNDGVVAFCFPLALEIVRPVASWSVSWSMLTAATLDLAGALVRGIEDFVRAMVEAIR